MFGFFQSIFSNERSENYPESLIKAAIEHAVDGTDPWIRAVSGYKKKLRPAVINAIDYVVSLVEAIPSPLIMDSETFARDSRLRNFFISSLDMQKIITSDINLINFQRDQAVTFPQIFTFMVMQKQEKAFLGAELSGDIILRDIPQVVVSFESHIFIDPADKEEKTRNMLKRRIFDHLLALALKRISIVKTERKKLEQYRELLQSKQNLILCGGLGFNNNTTDKEFDLESIEESILHINNQLLELGSDDKVLDIYLTIVTDLLNNPEKHLWGNREKLYLDRMGIKRPVTFSDCSELSIDTLSDDEGNSLVFLLLSISRTLFGCRIKESDGVDN